MTFSNTRRIAALAAGFVSCQETLSTLSAVYWLDGLNVTDASYSQRSEDKTMRNARLSSAWLLCVLGGTACVRGEARSTKAADSSAVRAGRASNGRGDTSVYQLIGVDSLPLPYRQPAGPEGDWTCVATTHSGTFILRGDHWKESEKSSLVCDTTPRDSTRTTFLDSGSFRRAGDTVHVTTSSHRKRALMSFIVRGDTLRKLSRWGARVYVRRP